MVQKYKAILFVVFLLFGMIITMQFRSILMSQQQNVMGQTSVQSLSAELELIRAEGIELQEQLNKIEEEIDEMEHRLNNDGNPLLSDLLKQLKEMQLKGGLTNVKGKGVIITLNDAPARDEQMDPSELIIHDSDILAILNELRAAGAQALAINDERIAATSKQICAGPTILINRNRYPVPYIIKAIGDPDTLYNALEESEAVVIMRIYNIQVDVQKQEEIIIPKFKIYEDIHNMISGLEVVEK